MSLIPPGYYQARAVRVRDQNGVETYAQFGRTQNGTHQVLMTFEIIEGEHQGRRLPWFGYFTTNAWQRTVESLGYCGFRGDDLSTIRDQRLDEVVSIEVEHDEYEGRIRLRVAWVNDGRRGSVQLADPMTGDELRHFSAQMKGAIRNMERGPANMPPPERRPAQPSTGLPFDDRPPPPSDDDIPF